ncbi:hypothetical protein HL653_19230 [Sphingomonas sp. AP4-R1]|uniref:hypothetical protein n=1 Tax=Sphingomonas sp. AP4-R1 TaxID=2735134 RepID=UPI001493B75A|nr:hypothetical protein [Sphingomonas sp. AP4-R1]QJU59603.1 hypothetical protein HL653_19230 [Sphingomonas sp. AP4-R1]
MASQFALPPRRMNQRRVVIVAGVVLLLLAVLAAFRLGVPSPLAPADPVEAQARRFVELALAFGQTDEKEVDAYFGPDSLRPKADAKVPSLDDLQRDLTTLAVDIAADPGPVTPRRTRLASRVAHLQALIGTIQKPRSLSFDEEARRVYGIDPAPVDAAAMARAVAELGRLLPGRGPLAARVDAFRARYVIPEDKREALFDRALGECRRRTRAHWPLPSTERVDVEWTTSVDAAWHRYRGNYHSQLQINPQAVAFLGSAIDVACHEAYPGHHAQFVMQTLAARPNGLPIEERVVLLRSPDSMFREGAANYGVDLAFPPADRLAFERDVLFPLAGFPATDAARFEKVRALIDVLAPATAPILRDYRDGRITADAAAAALQRDALVSSPQALLGFVDQLGAYALGYTVARDWVADRVAAAAGKDGDRWAVLKTYVAAPGMPSSPPPSTPTPSTKDKP